MKSIWNNKPLNEYAKPYKISFLNQYFYVDVNEKYKALDFLVKFNKSHKINLSLFLACMIFSILLLVRGHVVTSSLFAISSTLYFLPLISLKAIRSIGIKNYRALAKDMEILFLIGVITFLGVQLI